MTSRFLSTTRPILLILVIRDDTSILMKLVQVLVSLSMFLWLHKDTFLELAENINSAFMWLQAIKQTIKRTYLYLEYQVSWIKYPIPYIA